MAASRPEQIPLFDDAIVLRRDLDLALDAGDLAGAHTLLLRPRTQFGARPSELDLLDHVHALSAEQALDLWPRLARAEVDRRLPQAILAARLREVSPEALWRSRPETLDWLLEALRASGRAWDARCLVREALLAGADLSAEAAGDDRALGDLLAEPLPPVWLACLGAIQRLWLAPPLPCDGIEALAGMADAPDPACAFWACLRAAGTKNQPEAVLHEARRRMKRLHPELHARYMRRLL